MGDPLSKWWDCPLCEESIEIRRDNPYHFEDMTKVDQHKKDHQRYGMVLS